MRFDQRNQRGGLARRRKAERTKPQLPPLAAMADAVYGPALQDEATVHMIIDLALRIGEVQMSSGAGASDVTATIYSITGAYGLPHCEVDVIYTSITVSCHRGRQLNPITAVRVVRSRGSDYTRLAETERLAARISAGLIGVEAATTELDQVTSAPHPYPRWVATLAWGGLAGCISLLIGGTGLTASIAAVVTALVDRLGRQLNRRSMPFFFQQLIGGLLATMAALGIVYSGLFEHQLDEPSLAPSLIVAAAITVMLSGLSVVGTVQDAVTGYNVTAAGRSMEIMLMTLGLIAGVVLALKLGVQFGMQGADPRAASIELSWTYLPVQIVAGAGAAAFFALASYATTRALLVSAVAGALGTFFYYSLLLFPNVFDQVSASALAALMIGFCGGVMARRLRIPPVVVAVAGLTPLLPGLATYRALNELIVNQNVLGIGNLMLAMATALALGAGVVFGEYVSQPVRTGLGRLERKLAGPRMAGPLRPSNRPLE